MPQIDVPRRAAPRANGLTRLTSTPARTTDPDATRPRGDRAGGDRAGGGQGAEAWWTGTPQWTEPLPTSDPDLSEAVEHDAGLASRFTRKHVMVVAGALLLASLLAAYSMLRAQPADPVPIAEPVPEATPVVPDAPVEGAPSGAASPTAPEVLRVHVVGAVHHPGVHELGPGARVIDAVDSAGGLTGDASPGQLNFAQPVADGQQVWIGTHAEPGGEVRSPAETSQQPGPPGQSGQSGQSGPDGAASGDGQGLVNLNSASQAELEELPGVGPATAQKIITWREENGGFRSVEDLMEIRGIGEKTFAELAPLVTV